MNWNDRSIQTYLVMIALMRLVFAAVAALPVTYIAEIPVAFMALLLFSLGIGVMAILPLLMTLAIKRFYLGVNTRGLGYIGGFGFMFLLCAPVNIFVILLILCNNIFPY